jgi:hypothetical protein
MIAQQKSAPSCPRGRQPLWLCKGGPETGLQALPVDLLLERQDLLAQLEGALAAGRREGGQIAQVFGEAGIGKSSLLRRFEQRSGGMVQLIVGRRWINLRANMAVCAKSIP